jgi:signal transduction histidine kinase
LDRERVDMGGLCRTALETAAPRAAEKAQKLDCAIDPSTGFVIGDARRLRESIEHVLYNAVAYTDPKGRIQLEAAGDEQSVTVTIRDNGSGIPAEDLPRVFDRFHRVVETSVSGEAALGLGLPLTRQFIEAHGGTVSLESEEGKGTTVTMIIPRGAR